MSSSQDQTQISNNEDENFLKAMHLQGSAVISMVVRAAIELDLFEIMAKAGPGAQLSALDIASSLPTKNSQAPVMLDRILRFLSSYSVLKCSLVSDKRFYSLEPICNHYIRNQDGVSLAPLHYLTFDKVFMETWYHLKDAVLEGGVPFDKTHGTNAFEYQGIDNRFNEVFNKAMYNHTKIVMAKVLEVYNGFEGVNELLDVAGGLGASLACVVSKYPNIRGINFDLPHVIKDATSYPGVKHVQGDMFDSVPKAEVIFMKWILHDWSDDCCLKLLKNCWKALPESGKVIVVEAIVPEYPDNNCLSNIAFAFDIVMLTFNPGGKERTLKELEVLAKEAGFIALKLICRAYNNWVIELYKS